MSCLANYACCTALSFVANRKFSSSFSPASRKHRSACFRRHAGPKAMGVSAFSLVRLECSFHAKLLTAISSCLRTCTLATVHIVSLYLAKLINMSLTNNTKFSKKTIFNLRAPRSCIIFRCLLQPTREVGNS